MGLIRNMNSSRSIDIWRRIAFTPGLIVATGAIACSAPGENTTTETTATPSASVSQEQPDLSLPECESLGTSMVKSDPAMYRFKPIGTNLHSDFVHTPTALVVDFGDGSNLYDSSDFGLAYESPVVVEHEFPESDQEQTYRVTSGIRMHVMDEQRAPAGVEEGTIIDCPAREIVVAPSN